MNNAPMANILAFLRKALAGRCFMVRLFSIGSLLLPLGCGDPAGPAYETLVITTTTLPNAVTTVPYGDTLVATGGDGVYTWSLTVGSLPTGLSLIDSTGVISGTPSAEASDTFTVQVASGDGQTDTQQLTITVELPPVLQPSELCSDYPDYAIATFEDAELEAVIRETLLVTVRENLTCGLVSRETELSAWSRGITSLAGIQNLPSLQQLSLENNSIRDISALSRLTSLEDLDLYGNSISDIGALSGLTSLTGLALSKNSISDISALSGLTNLERLGLAYNSLSDISPLGGLTNLKDLWLDNNAISDISALSGLTSLQWLYLNNNSISDISALNGLVSLTQLELRNNINLTDIRPLLDRTWPWGGEIHLTGTSVSCTDVDALRAKNVQVSHTTCT